jgi:signal transduction histidine kinase
LIAHKVKNLFEKIFQKTDDLPIQLNTLTRRYIWVLLFIGLIAVSDHLFIHSQISINQSNARLITAANRQRNLIIYSARLAEALLRNADNERDPLRNKLLLTSQQMQSLQRTLLQGSSETISRENLSDELELLFFSPPHMLNSRLNELVLQIRGLANSSNNELSFENPHLLYIRNVIQEGELFDIVDSVLNQYQVETKRRIEFLKWFNLLNFGFILAILLMAGYAVFRPMTRTIRESIDQLSRANEHLQRELEKSAKTELKLVERAEQKKRTLAMLTHDLRTPIKGEYRVLEQWQKGAFGEITVEQHEILGELLHSNRLMNQMLDNMLTSFKYEEETIELALELVDINMFIQRIIDSELSVLAERKNQTLKTHFETPLEKIFLDPIEMRRVVVNIIQNALKYSPNNTSIVVKTKLRPGFIRFSITDEGEGISEELLPHLFKPYQSHAKKYRQIGTGLGLYLCKKIVEAHQGQLKVESILKEGSTFHVDLPRIK